MLVIYHFYEWTWSFCYCAYSNTFLSSLSSLYLSFDCITIINLLYIEIVCFLYYPYYLFVAGSHLNDLNAVKNQNSYQRDVIDAQKLLSGKKIYRVARVSGWSKFWSTRVYSQKRSLQRVWRSVRGLGRKSFLR